MENTCDHECETPWCDRPTPHTTVCYHCANTVRDQFDQITTQDLYTLHQVAIGQEQPATINKEKRNTRTSDGDIRFNIWQTWWNLTHHWPGLMDALPARKDAAKVVTGCTRDMNQAHAILYGENTDKLTPAEVAEKMRHHAFDARTPPDLSQWFKNELGIHITARRIQQLVKDGTIEPERRTKGGHVTVRPVSLYRHLIRKQLPNT
ncbi:hypothetical protein [Auritidibacter sp. NML100628]|uniref:hypothetical protein n=1 Tax=Auritidibacter sp. NML100628 TaxID=2170742 RepID=UPI000D733AD6|nr:hypothetical protein [Auritidibacter sp. NML100628]PXA77923.1 hypothetical protein DCC24_03245 [Auritidibacter sp. NML100628]